MLNAKSLITLLGGSLLCLTTNLSVAKMVAMDEEDLSEVGGAGIGFILDNFQIKADPETTFAIDADDVSSKLMFDHVKLYSSLSGDDGNTISDNNGITWGSASDPFRLEVLTDPTARDITGTVTSQPFISLKFPTGGTNATTHTTTARSGATSGSTGTRTIGKTTPYQCDDIIDCATLEFRARMDIYQTTTSGSTATAVLKDRRIQWWKIQGFNFNGSSLSIWADENRGLSASADIVAHIDKIETGDATNQNANVYAGGASGSSHSFVQNIAGYAVTHTVDTSGPQDDLINKTAPYSTDDTPDFDTYEGKVVIEDIDIELHIGKLSYQPLSLKPIFTATQRSAFGSGAGGSGVVARDEGVLDLQIELAAITEANAEHFYQQPKGHIAIGLVTLGADDFGNCASASGFRCTFGESYVQGLQIQSLKITTHDLPPPVCPGGNFVCDF